MKKTLTLAATVFMAFGLAGCNKSEEPAPSVNDNEQLMEETTPIQEPHQNNALPATPEVPAAPVVPTTPTPTPDTKVDPNKVSVVTSIDTDSNGAPVVTTVTPAPATGDTVIQTTTTPSDAPTTDSSSTTTIQVMPDATTNGTVQQDTTTTTTTTTPAQ